MCALLISIKDTGRSYFRSRFTRGDLDRSGRSRERSAMFVRDMMKKKLTSARFGYSFAVLDWLTLLYVVSRAVFAISLESNTVGRLLWIPLSVALAIESVFLFVTFPTNLMLTANLATLALLVFSLMVLSRRRCSLVVVRSQ